MNHEWTLTKAEARFALPAPLRMRRGTLSAGLAATRES